MKSILIIVGVAIVGEFLVGLLVGSILRFCTELDEAVESRLIPSLQRDSGKGLPREMPLKAADTGFLLDDDAA